MGSWALRHHKLNRFGRTGRIVRSITDPVLSPLERWLLGRGGNPQNAEWWLLGISVGGGILIITVSDWIGRELGAVDRAIRSGPRAVVRTLVLYAGLAVLGSLFIRVFGSWFGVGRYNRLMGPVYFLTDWIVKPFSKVISPVGMIDVTPFVAGLVFWLLWQWLLAII